MSNLVSRKAQCLSLLQDCLALQLHRVGPAVTGPTTTDTHYWMYDSGYLLFQGFLEANLKCFWDDSLVAAVRGLEFRGYVCPGVLLVTGNPPTLHLLRSAWSRNVLKPPPNYRITLLGDVEDCTISKVRQAGFTPLADAVCWVILQLGSSGQNAVLDSIRSAIVTSFPAMQQPSTSLLYDTLADLMASNKVYQTSQGYFVATPDSLRLGEAVSNRPILLTHTEAATMVHGEIITIREGAKTHQSIQTNLADVICGGNKSDKILYARSPNKNTFSRKLERRHSMRLLGSSRKLSNLHRAGSVRLLQNSNTESNKKCSLLAKLFRWPRRQPHSNSSSLTPYSAQFPPQEWFNSTVLHLHSVGTQTHTQVKSEGDWSECSTIRSTRRRSLSTSRLPRRQNRAPSVSPSRVSPPSTPSSSKTVLCTTTPKALSSASSGYNSLPRSHKSKAKLLPSNSVQNTPKSTPRHNTVAKNSIKVEVSSTPSIELVSDSRQMSASINDPSATTMTTTINGPNTTKIYVQQHNSSPMRSVITFEKSNRKPPVDRQEKLSVKEEVLSKPDLKRSRRPISMYQQQQKENTVEQIEKNSVSANRPPPTHLENNLKMKYPSSETIQLEEKLLLTDEKNNKNLCQTKKLFDTTSNLALKSGSLVDMADYAKDVGKMNNTRKASFPTVPLQSALSTDKVLESLNFKNILKETLTAKNDANKYTTNKINPQTIDGKKSSDTELCQFPSLNDLSLHFTSIAAQNILNGVSINSIDTLMEVNMAAEKQSNKDVSIHQDLGIV
ncbi:hypothetical protein O3M35_011929 [Rhynocoris fuscipes]|uniref:Winged helix Storkhead-box1 domain-containing protein n=1 Tax=Rhynocoris fuscipes TaxID=488301 RepID=A0AAW1CZW5_9HEMI